MSPFSPRSPSAPPDRHQRTLTGRPVLVYTAANFPTCRTTLAASSLSSPDAGPTPLFMLASHTATELVVGAAVAVNRNVCDGWQHETHLPSTRILASALGLCRPKRHGQPGATGRMIDHGAPLTGHNPSLPWFTVDRPSCEPLHRR
jgi:hypothetical protein